MAQVYLGLGSNIEPARNLRLGVRELQQRFGRIEASTVYRGPPVGFEGDDFLNMVVGLRTDLSPQDLTAEFDDIHRIAGRKCDGDKVLPRTLDIDLLLYGRLIVADEDIQLPRADVLEYAFVLRPLSELVPDYIHPLTGRTLREHWSDFDKDSSRLIEEHVEFG